MDLGPPSNCGWLPETPPLGGGRDIHICGASGQCTWSKLICPGQSSCKCYVYVPL